MFLQWLSYDLRPRSTIRNVFLSGRATIYDLDQPIFDVLTVAELRFTTQINQLSMLWQWLKRPSPANSVCFFRGRATTQINQLTMFCQWLIYEFTTQINQ